jgi:hypothetical protein
MFSTANSRMISFLAVALVALPGLVSAAPGYRPPDLEKEIFVTKAISLDKFDRSGLINALLGVARDFDDEDKVDYEVRAHALAVAYRLDKDNARVETALKQLKADGETVGEPNDKDRCAKRLASGIRALTKKKDVSANQLCAAYVCDIALRFDPKGDSASKIKEYQDALAKDGHKADWSGMLGSVIQPARLPGGGNPFGMDEPEETMEKKEVRMPGGTAKSFARNQSHANSLVVRQLDGGNFAGATSTVNATALTEKGLDGELLFTFNQGVGSMMAGSLEEVVKFLRVRYDGKPEKVPSGYRIELGFQDKYNPKDGPSAATLFTLLLDSLFSGEELDDGFACTGDITADGMVQKIGGTSGKIRGATKRGCKIVGIPQPNGKEVADVLLMDGPEQLLNIEIFTMKNFDEAYAISRKVKSAEVQAVLDDFTKIADVVKSKGVDTLKHPETQKRLETIVARMPNHLSAKLLLDYGRGANPKVLSIAGSFKEIQGATSGIFRNMSILVMRGMRDDDDKDPEIKISDDQKKDAKESLETLNKLDDRIDPKLKDFTKTTIAACQTYIDGPKSDEKGKAYLERVKEALEKVQTVQQKLQKDPDIMEDLME